MAARELLIPTLGLILTLGPSVVLPAPARARSAGDDPPGSRSAFSAAPVDEGDNIDPVPVEAQGVQIEERVGDTLPLDLAFTTSEGQEITLRDLFDGGLPVILTFNYSTCPMLCSVQLNALFTSAKSIDFTIGEQYRVVTVGLSPRETPEDVEALRQRYIESFPEDRRDSVRAGWLYLLGDEATIRAAADAVGVRYKYLPEVGEYSHPASLIFVSPRGIVTRYYHGLHYEPDELGRSIFGAGAGEHGVSVGFLLACFRVGEHEDYAKMGESVMRYGGIGFVVLLVAAFGTWQVVRTRKARQGSGQSSGRSSR